MPQTPPIFLKPVASGDRTVWILTQGRVGDLKQMQQLALALAWPSVIKRLEFRSPNIPFLSRVLLNRGQSDSLEPPWPDLILCAEARTSVIARLLKRLSRNAIKIVCLGRPAGSTASFDLVLTTAQYRLPPARNVVELTLPIGAIDADPPAKADVLERLGLSGLRRPLISVLVGGTSLPDRFDEAAALTLAKALTDYARQVQGTLVIITSPRTERGAAAALAQNIPAPHIVHPWASGSDNSYARLLSLADEFVVTSDSVSMAIDALTAGKPTSVYCLPQQWRIRHKITEWLYRKSWGGPVGRSPIWPAKWLFDKGLIEARPDRRLLFNKLVAQGRIKWFGQSPTAALETLSGRKDIETAVAHIKKIFAESEP